MGRAKSKHEKDSRRYRLRRLHRMERRRMFSEGFWDKCKAELISLDIYPIYNVDRGEILFDHRGYVNPSLDQVHKPTKNITPLLEKSPWHVC